MLPQAKVDIKKASKYYGPKDSELSTSFRDEVKVTTKYIKQYPEGFEIKHKAFRGCRVKRFPYIVFYRVHNDSIVVVAVLGSKQDRDTILDKR